MKKAISLILTLVLCMSLCACGKSRAVQAAIDAIDAIGEVSLNSEEVVHEAEKYYNLLTDNEKEKVDNRLVLVEARETLDKLNKIKFVGTWETVVDNSMIYTLVLYEGGTGSYTWDKHNYTYNVTWSQDGDFLTVSIAPLNGDDAVPATLGFKLDRSASPYRLIQQHPNSAFWNYIE